MSDVKLGQLVDGEPARDAVHVAVIVAEAGEHLSPGQHVMQYHDIVVMCATRGKYTIGIVDPFLKKDVAPGERFWLFMMPGTVQNLRHEWDADAFPHPKPEFDDNDSVDDDGCRGC